jgi:eukaryotic-like serine/threonine-protein kinase
MIGDTAGPTDDAEATTARATAAPGHSPAPTVDDPSATRVPIDATVAQTAPVPNDATSEWTPNPNEPTGTAGGRRAARHPAPGATVRYFGDYELQKELGRGGMGVVYKARQVSLNRLVALKMIKAGVLADEAELRRFQNEAEAVALLDHAGIVPVYEVGEHDSQKFFSMKLVQGGNLAEQLRTFTANPRAVATLLAETAEAVHHAHMRGILHRDLKPANILVDAEGHPHVTDFGLAKLIESDVELTASGAIMGTPSYMSPEQAAGRRGTITTATDVYGLGAILYALLAGKAPFADDSVVDTLQAVKERPPVSPRHLNPDVPRDLETICLKCLEKDPRRRYTSAQALADDLRSWLDSRPIAARRVGPAERAWLWCKRKPAVAALAATAAFAFVGGTAAVIVVQSHANRLLEGKNSDLQAVNKKLDAQRTRAQERELQAIDAVKRFGDAVSDEQELKNNPALEALRKRLLKEPLAFFKDLRGRLQSDRDTTLESLARLGHASFELGKLTGQIGDKQDALIAYRDSLPILRKLADDNPADIEHQRDLAKSYNEIGLLLDATGQRAESLDALNSALEIRRKLADANPTVAAFQLDVARAHQHIAIVLQEKSQPNEALKAFKLQNAGLKKLADANPTDSAIQDGFANSYMGIGLNLRLTGRLVEALEAYRSAEAILQKLADAEPAVPDHRSHLARAQGDIAAALWGLGEPAEALKAHESAVAISLKVADENPAVTSYQVELANAYTNMGSQLGVTGKPAEALKALESALKIRQKLADANPADVHFQEAVAAGHDNVSLALKMNRETAQALKASELGLSIRRKLARERPDSPELMSALGNCLSNQSSFDFNAKRYEAGCVLVREAIEWQRKALAASPTNAKYRELLSRHLSKMISATQAAGLEEEAAEAQRSLDELKASDPRYAALDARLAAVRKGEAPKDNAERLALAQRAFDTGRFAFAVTLLAEALETDPRVADNRQAAHRYNAACAAALAASGAGKDEPPVDDTAKAKLREQALDWLKAELAVWARLLESAPPQAKASIAQTLEHWQKDTDLSGVRGDKAIEALPEADRAAWRALWADVSALLEKARAAAGAEK